MDRRSFIKDLAISCAAGTLADNTAFRSQTLALPLDDDINAGRIPRWRGFNLQGRFPPLGDTQSGPAFDEFDFATMAEWGFNFARLPLSYWTWGSKNDWTVIREGPLKEIDRA